MDWFVCDSESQILEPIIGYFFVTFYKNSVRIRQIYDYFLRILFLREFPALTLRSFFARGYSFRSTGTKTNSFS